jgi:hypothetical protein
MLLYVYEKQIKTVSKRGEPTTDIGQVFSKIVGKDIEECLVKFNNIYPKDKYPDIGCVFEPEAFMLREAEELLIF